MPCRYIRDGYLNSEKIASLSAEAECLYFRLMLVVDDYGRYELKTIPIKNNAFQAHDNITKEQIIKSIKEIHSQKLIEIFTDINNKKCFEILNFNQQLRSKSKYPKKNDEEMVKKKQPKAWKRIYE